MRNKLIRSILAPLSLAFFSSASMATPISVPVYDANGNEFLVGDGIGIDGFTVDGDFANGGASVALRARNRDNMDPANVSGTVYTIDAGLSQIQNPTQPQLQFEWQFTSGALDTYFLELAVDFDPTAATDFAVIEFPFDSTIQGALLNGECGTGPCTWAGPAGNATFAIANSWNLGFDFWETINPVAANYDASAAGLYDIRLSAFEFNTATQERGSQLASVAIQANVVSNAIPEPGILSLLGLAFGSMLVRRRK